MEKETRLEKASTRKNRRKDKERRMRGRRRERQIGERLER